MGQRSRKRQRTGTPKPPPTSDRMREGYARGRERDERIRARLEPYAPGERPRAVTVAALVAVALGVGNLALMVAGVEVSDKEPPIFGTVVFALLMFVAAAGMWRMQYWAILGFEALLVLGIVVFALLLTIASDAFAVVLSLSVVLLGGWLFWKLIRVMARVQMPTR